MSPIRIQFVGLRKGDEKFAARSRDGAAQGPGAVLGVRVVVVVVAMMVMHGREHWAGKHHEKDSDCENLFHAPNLARKILLR